MLGTIHHLEDGEVPQSILAVGDVEGLDVGRSRLARLIEGECLEVEVEDTSQQGAALASELAAQLAKLLGPTAEI